MKANNVVLDGVTITWSDSRYMADSPPDDFELRGEFRVAISVTNATAGSVANAVICARTLQAVSDLGDLMCPHSDARLRPVGLTPSGSVLLQVFRGARKHDAVSVLDMASLDPSAYSKDETAMRSVVWMRDVARAICDHHDAQCRWRDTGLEALHAAVYCLPMRAKGGA